MSKSSYSAKDIQVLEGLEPVRHRPGMYIGGTGKRALHHMILEVVDNAIDEVVAGYAKEVEVCIHNNGFISISDDGRGIPIDSHEKYPDKSALEVILTTLHSGGKFVAGGAGAYQTSGGLHGVGLSVVNALSEQLIVEVKRENKLYRQEYARGAPQTGLNISKLEGAKHKTGTKICFLPDPEIFDDTVFDQELVRASLKSKAYLCSSLSINFILESPDGTLAREVIRHTNGLVGYIEDNIPQADIFGGAVFSDVITDLGDLKKIEWAIAWQAKECRSVFYCNTIHNPNGGEHESGARSGIVKGIRQYSKLTSAEGFDIVTPEDILSSCVVALSIFITDPLFQGQTKDVLLSPFVFKAVEAVICDKLEHFLISNTKYANEIIKICVENAKLRQEIKRIKKTARKTAVKWLKLPGKLADCISTEREGTEFFIVEGDSAGGTAKQARDKMFQAVMPLKGKIINIANSSADKVKANQEIIDLFTALGCGVGAAYDSEKLRYDKVIIMTDADVDGAHISSLLMTLFCLETPKLITDGHLYIAKPPLYKVKYKEKVHYVHSDNEKDKLVAKLPKATEVSRFKGLGEMNPSQLKSTTMDPKSRVLLRVIVDDLLVTNQEILRLMGKKPEFRLQFIREMSASYDDLASV